METFSVTLIVKAPNQQIEDQTIKCDLSWTINKLKQHLSEVYPSRPAKHEQRLIYSGQLLSDTVVLGDVLRQYEGQETYTLHLVCTSKHMNAMPPPISKSQQQSSTASSNEEAVTNNASTTPGNGINVTPTTAGVSNSAPTEHNGSEFIRQPPFPTVGQWNAVPPTDFNQYMMQMVYMQQAYWQYMNHYMQLNQAYQNGTSVDGPAVQEPDQAQQAAAAAVQDAAQNQRDPDQMERDWLDVFYFLGRLLILFSVVYFYSSPLRFVIVVFLGLWFYLYQIGFFRNVNNINNNNNNNVRDGEQNQQEQAENPSMLTTLWTFFAMFFTSLIPEIPQAV